jgi:hypothetical protein
MKLLLKRLSICLLILWSIKTTAQTNPDTILDKGIQAPYSGVLISPDNYRKFSIGLAQADDFKSNLSSYVNCPSQAPTINLFGVGGLEVVIGVGVLALIGGMMIGHNY